MPAMDHGRTETCVPRRNVCNNSSNISMNHGGTETRVRWQWQGMLRGEDGDRNSQGSFRMGQLPNALRRHPRLQGFHLFAI